MKKVIALLTVLTLIFALAGCGASNTESQSEAGTKAAETTEAATSENTSESSNAADETAEGQNNETDNGSKTLVVYFSATGNTKAVAQRIASAAGADLYEIIPAEPYTADDLDYNDSGSRTTIEQNDKNARPAIGSETIPLDGYSTIFIGYPIWHGQAPRIMDTFVESYDFTDKTVIPFCTSGSSDIGSSGSNLASNAGSGNWLEGKRLSADADIEGWSKEFI